MLCKCISNSSNIDCCFENNLQNLKIIKPRICVSYTIHILGIGHVYTRYFVTKFWRIIMLSETFLASTLDYTWPWHGLTALGYKYIQDYWIRYRMHIHGIYHVYTGSWYIHGIYMVYTWYIPFLIFLRVPIILHCFHHNDYNFHYFPWLWPYRSGSEVVDCDLATIQLQWFVETVELPGRGKDKSTIRNTYDTLKERQLSLGR